ncbi:MAG: LolA-related protein [Acetobacter orientalis]|uniref:LolA-related protein n=1 Tax=Acetobacter orientalis TaxID=146474 RepID=UPI0039E8D25A
MKIWFMLACGVCVLHWAQPVFAQDLADSLITRLGQVQTRQKPFHETRTLAALKAPLESSGVLIYRHPGYLQKTTEQPRAEDLVINGDMVTISRNHTAPQSVDTARVPALRLLADTLRAPLDGDAALLRRYYHITATEQGADWSLYLTPASDKVAALAKSVTLSGKNNAILRIVLVQANGDTQTMTIAP